MTTGDLSSMIAYAMNILNCLMMLLQVFVMINMARASCERIIEVSDEESSLKNGREPIYEMQNRASLSRRQRQLLSIACAAVANLPVMILDEATSSIDIRTEVLVQQGMDNLMRGRTTYVIAHWLSMVCNSETIIVLNFGKIIEWGSHDELISKHDVYYSLYTDAFELE